MPVGPVDQYPLLAGLLNQKKVSCRDVAFVNMDEYLDAHDEAVSETHPLSFRGYMNRAFYHVLDASLAPLPANRVFPEPHNPDALGEFIAARGGVDVCYGGIGINGHVAFNEPPEPGEAVSVEKFAKLPTRNLSLSRETMTINSVTVGGEIGLVPRRAVTVGMKEILAARKLRFYCNRPWQSAVVRRVLHGPLTPACPGVVFPQTSRCVAHDRRLRGRAAADPITLNMKLNFKNERVLAVVAHPDDAELLCAGTLARARQDGAEIGVCVLCRGDKGQPRKPVANLTAVRRKEMAAAAKLLGAKLFYGENPDGQLRRQ